MNPIRFALISSGSLRPSAPVVRDPRLDTIEAIFAAASSREAEARARRAELRPQRLKAPQFGLK